MTAQNYEYKILPAPLKEMTYPEKMEAKLNDLGEEGWKLCDHYDNDGTTMQYILRRPLE